MKTLQRIAAISLIATFAASGVAFAEQNPAPAAPAAATKTTDATADKSAISKACSQQADAKGLHGKARKKFRSQCKKNGGKAE
jgi:psiF repeat